MKVVINSHVNSTIALNHLLESLKEHRFHYCDVIVVIGGHYELDTYKIKKENGIIYVRANHNSIDYTGLITLLETCSHNNEHYVYLHDTCKIGPHFQSKLKSINLTNVSTIKINRDFSMNIGIYSQKIINEFREFLLSKKNTKEEDCMHFKLHSNEDYIFHHDKNNKLLDNYSGWISTGPTDYYNTGTMRIVEYYPNLDIYKIKANWGQGKWTLNN